MGYEDKTSKDKESVYEEISIATTDMYTFTEDYIMSVEKSIVDNPDLKKIHFQIRSFADTLNTKIDKSNKNLVYVGNFVIDVESIKNKMYEKNNYEPIAAEDLAQVVLKKLYKQFRQYVNFH